MTFGQVTNQPKGMSQEENQVYTSLISFLPSTELLAGHSIDPGKLERGGALM